MAVVDDDRGMRSATAALLSAFGYGTETFESAEAFLIAAATSRVACLVVDIQLGDITGVELGRHLRANGCKLPIIFMTALEDETIERQATALGCVAYLRKPFQADLLVDAVINAMGSPHAP